MNQFHGGWTMFSKTKGKIGSHYGIPAVCRVPGAHGKVLTANSGRQNFLCRGLFLGTQQSLCHALFCPMVKNNTRQKFESKKLETNGKKNLIGEGHHRLAPNNKVASRGIFSRNIHVLHGICDSNPWPPLAPNLLYRSTTFSLVFISDFFLHILY